MKSKLTSFDFDFEREREREFGGVVLFYFIFFIIVEVTWKIMWLILTIFCLEI